MTFSTEETAALLLDVVPRVMHGIRREMRAAKPANLSMARFRALLFLKRHPGAGTSHLAEHFGISAPSASRLASGLVKDALAERTIPDDDRRRVGLAISEKGLEALEIATRGANSCLRSLLTGFDAEKRKIMCLGLSEMRNLFPVSSEGAFS